MIVFNQIQYVITVTTVTNQFKISFVSTMYQITMCNLEGVLHGDKPTDNY